MHQGRTGNGPASNITANSHETKLTADDYDKIDLIMEYNKQDGATSYLFANGKYMGSYYDSGLTDKHFHGIVFRILKGSSRKLRGNSDYVALKFDADRIGHREYYNTDDYVVTIEDVMQDAGLGGALGENMIYKSAPDALEWYMPGNNQTAYTYESDYSERKRINTNVTYSGTAAVVEATNTSDSYKTAAKMLSGFYPINGKTGISYESYHPRAKYIKLSFDQTISNDAMWLEYKTRYSGTAQALQMWDNDGSLVVGIKGGSNVTCNGNGNKPEASTTGTNHFDWILEPDEENGCMKQYVFVNGEFAGEGSFGSEYAVRVADIILSTKNAAGTVKIDNWSMTLYKDEVVLDENGNFIIPEPEPVEPVVIEEVDMGGYEGKAWDVVINEFDSEATYSAVFTDGEDSIDGEIGFDNVETEGSIAFAVFLHTSRANVAFDIVAE